MKNYHELLKQILETGEQRDDRTGIGTRSIFGSHLRYDLTMGFPAITTKKLAFNACKAELLWFLEGSGNERRLAEITHGTSDGTVTIWTPNALAPYWKPKAKYEGDLGRVYGVQWRNWQSSDTEWQRTETGKEQVVNKTIDQVAVLIDGLKNNPYSRRHIISAWNVAELDQMALPPCHVMSQFYVSKDKKLSCHMYQRSVDAFLGLPFNIASYALLTHLVAQVCDMGVGELIISMGDTHIYNNHEEQVREQLSRTPIETPVELRLNKSIKDINQFKMTDIELVNYLHLGQLKAPMAV